MNPTKLLALAIAIALSTTAFAQQQAPPITVTKLKDNVYWVRGGGGSNDGVGSNNGFIVGSTSVIVIDTKTFVDVEERVIAEIAKVTPKPIATVILTHSDEDHVNGLPAFPPGVTVVAQENCKNDMERAARLGIEPCVGCRTQGQSIPPQNRMPTKLFAKRENLNIDGVRIRLYHWAQGHTNGDAVIYLPDEKVVFAGDLLVNTRPDPLVHTEKKGSAVGWIENAKGMLALDADTYLTGHGSIMSKADVQKKLEYVEARYAQIRAMVAQGKSLDEVKTSFGLPVDPPGATNATPAIILVESMYKEAGGRTGK